MNIEFELNGNTLSIDEAPMIMLSEVLRKQPHLESIHAGCSTGECGNCSVLINNHLSLSCLVPVFSVRKKSVITFEGFKKTKECTSIIKGFSEAKYIPCDYCKAGKILSIHSILEKNLNPVKQEILENLSGSTCFCGSFNDLIQAIYFAANNRKRQRRVRKR